MDAGKGLVPKDKEDGEIVSEKSVLTKRGYRLTDQRQRIIDLLRSQKRHLSAENIHALLHHNKQRVSLATVYRTLDLLTRLNLVRKLEVNGKPTVFEVNEGTSVQTHYHLVCRQCGKVEDIPISSFSSISRIEELEKYLAKHHHFDVSDHQIIFLGVCEACKGE